MFLCRFSQSLSGWMGSTDAQLFFIAKIHPLSLHDKQQMCGMGHKVRICMKDTNNSQQTVSAVKTVLIV